MMEDVYSYKRQECPRDFAKDKDLSIIEPAKLDSCKFETTKSTQVDESIRLMLLEFKKTRSISLAASICDILLGEE